MDVAIYSSRRILPGFGLAWDSLSRKHRRELLANLRQASFDELCRFVGELRSVYGWRDLVNIPARGAVEPERC